MNYWPRWVNAIKKRTATLSLMEMGAYDRLLDHYYAEEQPLPADLDECCRIAVALTKDERKAVEKVLHRFFVRDGHFFRSAEVDADFSAPISSRTAWFNSLPREKRTSMQAARRARQMQAQPSWLSADQLAEVDTIYAKAASMFAETGDKHHVDHIVPLAGSAVCGLHVPWNLQVLTATKNMMKGNAV